MSDDNQTHSKLEKLLLQSSRILNDTVEYEDLIRLALQLVCHAVRCEAAFVFRIDEKLTHRRVRLLKSGEQSLKLLSKQPGSGITGWALETGQPVILNDPASDPRYAGEIARQIDFPIRSLIVIPLESRGKTFGALEAVNKIDGEFSELDRDTLLGLSSQIAVSIDNSQLLRAARRQARERERLLEVAGKISGALNTEQALHMIMDAVKELVGFDAGGIFLIDLEKREFGKIFFRGYDPDKENELHIKLDSGLIGWVAQNGGCVWVPDVTQDERYVPVRPETRSELVVPMSIDGKTIGVFNLESNETEAYDGHSADLLQAFGAQAAVVIERTRLNEKIVAARALEKQLEIAHQIQSGFLPLKDPEVPGYQISGMNIASGEVGGDYYGFIDIAEGHMGLAIADVAGKGVPAALLMASFRASLLAEIRNNFTVREICAKVNRLIHESVEPGDYVTAVYGALDTDHHRYHYSNAGHNPPILMRANGDIELLEAGGPPIGIVADTVYEEATVTIDPGDVLFAYTDGVTEAENTEGEQYGEERLIAFLRDTQEMGAVDICCGLHAAVRQFIGAAPQSDDLTLLVVKRNKS